LIKPSAVTYCYYFIIEPKTVIVGVRFIEPDGLDKSSPYKFTFKIVIRVL
jgi:hypothetical protein